MFKNRKLLFPLLTGIFAIAITLQFRCALTTLSATVLALLIWLRKSTKESNQIQDTQSKYFEAFAESMIDLLSIQDVNQQKPSYFNRRWADYSGLSPQTPGFWEKLIHPEDFAPTKTYFRTSLKGLDDFSLEYRLRRHDGQYRWHQLRGVPLKGAKGEIYKWIFTSTDVHTQRTLLHELSENTKLMAHILEQLPSGVVIYGPDRKVLLKNRRAMEHLALDDSYKIGSLKGFHSDGRAYEQHEWPLVRAFETRAQVEEELLIQVKNRPARNFRLNAAPVFGASSEMIAAVCIVDDITEHKRAEILSAQRLVEKRAAIEVKRSMQMLETLVENLPVLLMIKETKNFTFIRVNKSGQDLIGKTEAELIGKCAHDVLPKDEADFMLAMEKEIVQENKTVQAVRQVIHLPKSGTRVLLMTKFVLCPDEETKLLVTISHDITGIVESEKQMIQARIQAEQVAKMKSEFLANMSHEIRTPLNGVIGMTDLLSETNLSDEQAKFTNIIQDSGKALLTIVNDILDFSKIESGHMELEMLDFNPRLFFSSQLELLKIRAESKNLTFLHSFAPNLPSLVKGEPGRIGQILMNLIGNSVKFTATGEIKVHAELEEALGDEVTIRFSVTDTGIGISAEEQSRLFKPFVQGDGSTARRYGGTGLGLSICKKLTQLMGGKIGVTSQKDAGSTFWFTVRLKNREANAQAAAPESAAPVTSLECSEVERKKHILLAEDNPTNQLLGSTLLKKMGYIPHVVANGNEVLSALKNFRYDLILMDCQMPELDGYEATTKIRELEKISQDHIPIVALSANVLKEDREKCLAVGMDAFVPKPVNRSELEEVLKNLTLPGALKADRSARTLKRTVV